MVQISVVVELPSAVHIWIVKSNPAKRKELISHLLLSGFSYNEAIKISVWSRDIGKVVTKSLLPLRGNDVSLSDISNVIEDGLLSYFFDEEWQQFKTEYANNPELLYRKRDELLKRLDKMFSFKLSSYNIYVKAFFELEWFQLSLSDHRVDELLFVVIQWNLWTFLDEEYEEPLPNSYVHSVVVRLDVNSGILTVEY